MPPNLVASYDRCQVSGDRKGIESMTLMLSKTKNTTSDREQERERLIAALYRTEGKAEIVNAEIIEYMATAGILGYIAGEIFAEIRAYARATKRGYAVGDNVGFVVRLTNRHSFSPDAAYWTGDVPTMKFYEGAPVFAVEVRSENDYGAVAETEMRDKRRDYFAAGTEVVWDVDTTTETATVRKYTKASGADTPAQTFGKTDTADAAPTLQGFRVAVSDLFPTKVTDITQD